MARLAERYGVVRDRYAIPCSRAPYQSVPGR